MDKNSQWVVTMFFDRGHVVTEIFEKKQDAERIVRIAVFNNEDCINCSIYRRDRREIIAD